MSPSRAPVLSFARYFQAPATQAIDSAIHRIKHCEAGWRSGYGAGIVIRRPPVQVPALISVLAGFVLSDPECKIANWFAPGQLEILNPQRATMKSTDVTETVLPL